MQTNNSKIMKMKKILKQSLFIIISSMLVSCTFTKKPNMILSNYQIKFGEVKEGSQCSADIKLYNRGSDILNIRTITTDCSCTNALIDNKNIAPNDSTTIHLLLNTKGKNGDNENFVIIQANTDTVIHYISVLSNVITTDSN